MPGMLDIGGIGGGVPRKCVRQSGTSGAPSLQVLMKAAAARICSSVKGPPKAFDHAGMTAPGMPTVARW